jgi:hypothetical protein
MHESSISPSTIKNESSTRTRLCTVVCAPILSAALCMAPTVAKAESSVITPSPPPPSFRLTPTVTPRFATPQLMLQTDSPTPAPPPRGLGLLISGSVVTGTIGLPFMIWGSVVAAAGSRAVDGGGVIGVPFILVGILGLGAGVPMLAVGAHRLKRYNQWKSQHARIVPTAGRTAMGTWTGGVAFSF